MNARRLIAISAFSWTVALSAQTAFRLEMPLRDPSICRAPDGIHYLTGTAPSRTKDRHWDYDNNDGVYLWRSADLKKWEPMGRVWDFVSGTQRMVNRESRGPKHWLLNQRVADAANPSLAYGIRAPRLGFVDGKPWIALSNNGNNCGAIVSEGGAIAGPYRFTGIDGDTLMGDGSVFQDKDGKAYLIWGPGYLAEITPARDRIILPATNLATRFEGWPHRVDPLKQRDVRGFHILRSGDAYLAFYTARTIRDGREHTDLLMSRAPSLTGPYATPLPALADVGSTASAFEAKTGQLMAVAADPDGQLRIAEIMTR